MKKMDEEHGIKGSVIHGYETLSCNTKIDQYIEDHPGFKRIVYQLNSNMDELRIWMQEGHVTTNKKGVLWNHLDTMPATLMSRGQLVDKARQLPIVNQKYDELKMAHDALQAAYIVQGDELKKKNEEIKIARDQNDVFFNQLCQKISECGAYQRRLIENRIDATWTPDH